MIARVPKLLVAALVGLLGCPRAPEQPPREREQQVAEQVSACGRVVFVETDADERSAVRVMPAAGGAIEALPNSARSEDESTFPAAVSPDGRTLLLLSSREHGEGKTRDRFALLDLADEAGEVRALALESGEQQLRNPAWAPDGSWLVFESDVHSFRDLYRVELGSGVVLRLTDDPEGNFEPAVSPDGQRIAFVSSRAGNAEIYVMTADGGAPQRLTTSPGDDTAPRWSPDGRTLAFCSARERARGIDVFVMDGDGRDPRPLVRDGSRTTPIIAGDLAFSPDGSQLAFAEHDARQGVGAIVVVSLATGEVTARIASEGIDEQPTWSPDGRFLAFARGRGARSDIVRVRADGTAPELLTDGTGQRWLPRWIADPECARVAPAIDLGASAGRG